MMRDDTRRIASRLLWKELEGLPLGTHTSVEALAKACPTIVGDAAEGYGIAGRESLHDELDLDVLEMDLWGFAEERGLYVERSSRDFFALRNRVVPSTPLDPSQISWLRFGTFTFLDVENDIAFGLSDSKIWLRRGVFAEPLERAVDTGVLSALADVLVKASVGSWKQHYEPKWGVLDGTSWELVIMFDDDSVFESNGVNAWPEGYDALVGGLLGLFEGHEAPAIEGQECENAAGQWRVGVLAERESDFHGA